MRPVDQATQAVPSVPRDPDGPVFREPWEAHAFAIAVALHERGLFTWPEWAATLADQIKRAQAEGDPDAGDTYYSHWLAALERLVAEKGAADPGALARCRAAWQRAALRTPHGSPIALQPEDFAAD
jgi:nitrile hydratase accessory protein